MEKNRDQRVNLNKLIGQKIIKQTETQNKTSENISQLFFGTVLRNSTAELISFQRIYKIIHTNFTTFHPSVGLWVSGPFNWPILMLNHDPYHQIELHP